MNSSHAIETKSASRAWKRRYARYRVNLTMQATILRESGYEVVQGRCGDLAVGGLGAILLAEVTCGEVVSLEFQLGDGGEVVRTRAIVRYRKGLLHGLEFVSLSADQRDAILRYCAGQTQIGAGPE